MIQLPNCYCPELLVRWYEVVTMSAVGCLTVHQCIDTVCLNVETLPCLALSPGGKVPLSVSASHSSIRMCCVPVKHGLPGEE